MQAFPKAFQEIVRSNRRLVIPRYQRHYRWGPRQYAALVTDILDQYRLLRSYQGLNEDEQNQLVGNHYMGAVVLRATDEGADDWDVIDGQQRLTTVSLLLAAVRDALLPIAGSDARSMSEAERTEVLEFRKNFNNLYFITPPTRPGAQALPRLVPQRRDEVAYNAIVNWNDPTLSLSTAGLGLSEPTNTLPAYAYFKKVLRLTPEKASGDKDFAPYEDLFPLDAELIQSIAAARLLFIEVRTSSVDDANAIFESLNFKVVPLGPVDLLKNYLFMLLRRDEDRLLQEWWQPSVARLGGEVPLGDFILSDMVAAGHGVSRSKLYESKQGQLRRISAKGGREALWTELTRMRASISRFLEATTPEQNVTEPSVRGALRAVHAARGYTSVPFLMFILEQAERERAGTDEIVHAIRLVESYLMRRFICGLDSHNLNSYFSSMLVKVFGKDRKIYADMPLLDRVAAALDSSSSGDDWPSDAQLRQSILTGRFYNQGIPSQRTLVFKRLDQEFGQRLSINYEESSLELEHVFPQSPDSGGYWESVAASDGHTFADFQQRYLDGLANIIPLLKSENGKASNKPFAHKLKVYGDSSILLTKDIASTYSTVDVWGQAQLFDRAARLAAKASKVWPKPIVRISAGPTTPPPEEEIDEGDVEPLVNDTLPEDALEPALDVEASAQLHTPGETELDVN